MAKYINLDKLNDILHEDKREALTKHQVWLMLNYHPELVVEIEIDTLITKLEKELLESKGNITKTYAYQNALDMVKELLT